ncbi:MAG: acetyl-CoA hydrolase [Halioglobus sp.]|nr:acetyl-CoA hydrolase [Halioglobus sp.]
MSDVVNTVEACVERAIAAVGNRLIVGAPLGLGKPVQLMNAFYARACDDAAMSLHIVTALCLELPQPDSEIEATLFDPIRQRLFGDYEELAFYSALRANRLPDNVQVTELYFRAGSMKHHALAQQNYVSSNYTHIVRDMMALGVNVMVQLVAARETSRGLSLSLSCNPDLTLEVLEKRRVTGLGPLLLAQVHDDLPFMTLDAEVEADAFDTIVWNPKYNRTLFAVPNPPVPEQDYAMAMHASSLIADGGTLQIGIGALGDALARTCILRQQHNDRYQALLAQLGAPDHGVEGGVLPFVVGLYVSTEMFVNGMLQLIDAGIVKREVYDNLLLQKGINSGDISDQVDEHMLLYCRDSGLLPRQLHTRSLAELQYWGILGQDIALTQDGLIVAGRMMANDMDDPEVRRALLAGVSGTTLRNGRLLHGGFYLGPKTFYARLRKLDPLLRSKICMTAVQRTNQLLLNYPLYSAQRTKARFINTGMIASLNGSVASDALEDGTVISGVGGQYNFVAMAHDLPGARSILCIRSTRGAGKQLRSNIVANYGYTTIPKHLRDVVVTEYGVADLRGQSDSEVVKRLINIADSRFQEGLLKFAKDHNKLPVTYEIPVAVRNNTPERLRHCLATYRQGGLLPEYPFGSELTEQERALVASLRAIKALSREPTTFVSETVRALLHRSDPEAARPFLERVQLEHPGSTREFLMQQLLLLQLEEHGVLKVS